MTITHDRVGNNAAPDGERTAGPAGRLSDVHRRAIQHSDIQHSDIQHSDIYGAVHADPDLSLPRRREPGAVQRLIRFIGGAR